MVVSGKAARIAFNADDLASAYQTGVAIGDWWTAGLSAWRLERWEESFLAFERVAENPVEDAWVRAGAAVWAARRDAQFVEVVRRHLRYPAWLRA